MMNMADSDGNYGGGWLPLMRKESKTLLFSRQVRALDSGQLFRVKKARGNQEENQRVDTKWIYAKWKMVTIGYIFLNHHSRLMEIKCWKDSFWVDVSGCMWMWWEYPISGVESVRFSGIPKNGTPVPYYSHTTPIRITEAGRRTWCWLRPVLEYKLLLRPSRRGGPCCGNNGGNLSPFFDHGCSGKPFSWILISFVTFRNFFYFLPN